MTVEELEARIKTLEDRIRTMEDIEEIKKLHRSYGFYIEHRMAEDIIDLFADRDDIAVKIAAGQFIGKENVIKYWRHGYPVLEKADNPEFLHQVMQLSGVVHVDPDGKTAKGRWYGFGANAFVSKGGVAPNWMNGVYENEYVKENGKWKIKVIHWCMTFNAPFGESWVSPSRRVDRRTDRPYQQGLEMGKATDRMAEIRAIREPPAEDALYPSGFICPFHFANPVSGRNTV
jgi:hypothetical protein